MEVKIISGLLLLAFIARKLTPLKVKHYSIVTNSFESKHQYLIQAYIQNFCFCGKTGSTDVLMRFKN